MAVVNRPHVSSKQEAEQNETAVIFTILPLFVVLFWFLVKLFDSNVNLELN